MLLSCIERIKRQSIDAKIVVVEATDAQKDIEIDGVEYIRIPEKEGSFSKQRNIAIRGVRTEWILFVDDDVVVTENWLKEMLKAVEDHREAIGIMGAVFPYRPNVIGFCEGVLGHPGGGFRLHHFSRGKIIALDGVATCNTIFRKKILEDVGMFAENLRYGGEDTELCYRIVGKYGKNKLFYTPSAQVFHVSKNNLLKFVRWYIRRGKADIELYLHHHQHLHYILFTSILLKIFPCLLASLLLGKIWILGLTMLVWSIVQWKRSSFMFAYFSLYSFGFPKRCLTFFVFPLLKLVADVSFDVGRILRLFRK